MQIKDILTPDRMLCHVQASSKKRVFEYFSKLLATETSKLGNREILNSLLARERLGSTGLGRGVAIPHARVSHCDVTLAAFLQLDQGIDYDAIDRQPVDLLFALVVPEHCTDEHLQILAHLAEMFSDATFREQLRNGRDCGEKYKLFAEWQPSQSPMTIQHDDE
ncbi:PTS IIA-like nitrogen regulatory protein PtsN [Thioflexithrix psekupsensis]|uniref:PTS IIA-like nitrogen-regulatory protein PtsN n=1 Tax=Thioflexithrix psekupsensis TaxID=1570016 RepID=A0A251X5J0_9GAMM|nr:PTS IIA-like nitrogen regulatory protein PtsN [Thioflexithrix psekupsensis]OUD12412.1 PTS IIA-like nitrogen-regulatory protein PtsN [Thioflexithrix psekupsensis]